MGRKGKGKSRNANPGNTRVMPAEATPSQGAHTSPEPPPTGGPDRASRVAATSHARDLAQQRARHAWETVKTVKAKGPAVAKDFGGQAKRLPMRVRAAGLGQALAFVRAKARPGTRDEKPGLILLLERLGGWVLPRLDPAMAAPDSDSALLQAILEHDATFLRRATLEAMAWLEWVNRFAEAEGLGDDHDTAHG